MFGTIGKVVLLLLATSIATVVSILSPCNRPMSCPIDTRPDESGSGVDEIDLEVNQPTKYTIQVNESITAQGKVLIVKLQFYKCIPFNKNERIGPKWYKIEAISEETGLTTGEFIDPPFNSESELCSADNVIKFYTITPTVLDLPRRYQWKPTVKESAVSFRVTLQHSHNRESSCTTITKRVSNDKFPIIAEPAPAPAPAPSNPYPITREPSAKKRAACANQWNCSLPKFKTRTFCICNKEKTYCKEYSKKCEIRLEECLYDVSIKDHAERKKCPAISTIPPPVTPTPSPPTVPPPPIKGNCKAFYNNPSQCTTTGDFKLTQCMEKDNGEYSCYCADYASGAKNVYTERLKTSCESPDTYDLGCIRQ